MVEAAPDAVFSATVAILAEEGFEIEVAERDAGYIKATKPYGESGCTWLGVCTHETLLIYTKDSENGCMLTVSPRNEKVLASGQRTTSQMGMPGRIVDHARELANTIKRKAEGGP